MSCAACAEAQQLDNIVPPCRTDVGCWIPPLDQAGDRIIKLRQMRLALGELVDSATICRVFEREHGLLTWQDLKLLAAVEDYHRAKPEEEPHDG